MTATIGNNAKRLNAALKIQEFAKRLASPYDSNPGCVPCYKEIEAGAYSDTKSIRLLGVTLCDGDERALAHDIAMCLPSGVRLVVDYDSRDELDDYEAVLADIWCDFAGADAEKPAPTPATYLLPSWDATCEAIDIARKADMAAGKPETRFTLSIDAETDCYVLTVD